MNTREAIAAVLPFAGKADSGYQFVRLSPSEGPADEYGVCAVAAYAEATDGQIGSRAYIEGECPLAVLFGTESLTSAFKVIKRGSALTITPRSTTIYNFQGDTGAHQYVSCYLSTGTFKPKGPAALTPLEAHQDFVVALHAVPKPTKEFENMESLTYVHVTPRGIETCDQNRMCFIRRPGLTDKARLLPRILFQKWPTKDLKTRAALGFTDTHAFLWADGQLRWGTLLLDKVYPDLDPHLPESHLGHRVMVDRESLKGTVRDAYQTLPTGSAHTLELRFGENDISVQAIDAQEDGDVVTYRHTVEVLTSHSEVLSVLVNGKFLYESLNAHNGKTVTLCYPLKNSDPLRVEDERATSVISQLQLVKVPA